jgi:protocatechuate 3,4-dioxygenase beta subunit
MWSRWIGIALALVGMSGALLRANERTRVVLDGQVTAPDGQPVGGALVLGTLEFGDSASTFRTEAAGDGSFALALVPAASPLRSIRVFAYAAGYSNSSEIKTPVKGTPSYKPVVLRLRPTISLDVTVVDPQNAPVATATVTIAADSFSTEHPNKGITQPVDAHGKVRFANLNDKDSLSLVVAAPGYLSQTWPNVELSKPQRFQIARGGRLQVRLVDRDDGMPIVDCKLTSDSGEAISDAGGRIELVAPYGAVTLWPQCARYGTDYNNAPSGLLVEHKEADVATVHEVRVRKNHVITGRVLGTTGQPVVKAQVVRQFVPENPYQPMFIKRGPPSETATTDEKGRFTFSSSSMDVFEIFVMTPGQTIPLRVRFVDLRGPIELRL